MNDVLNIIHMYTRLLHVLMYSFSLQLFTECHLIQKLLDGFAKNEEMYVEQYIIGIIYCIFCYINGIAAKMVDVIKATWSPNAYLQLGL